MADDAERHTMGQRGRELVAAKYQWDAAGRAMAGVYESVVERQGRWQAEADLEAG